MAAKRPWLQLPRLAFLYGYHCSFLPASKAADVEAPIAGSKDNSSFEVPANGNPRLIRAEQSQSEEDMQAGPVQEAALVWMNETTPYDDNCGSRAKISTCGFKTKRAIKFTYGKVLREIHGLCVCVGDPPGTATCTEPTCTDSTNVLCRTNGRPFCADGETCITQSGKGWQCWDPCDLAKDARLYGGHLDMVTHMREKLGGTDTTICSQHSPAQAASSLGSGSQGPWLAQPASSSLGGGQQMSSAPSPYLGGQRTPSAQSRYLGQPVSSAQSPHLGPVSSSNVRDLSWGRNPPLDAGLYLAYNRNPFGGRVVVGED